MERIKCTIDHITYQNQENGYAVLQAIVKGYRDKQTLVGTFHEVKACAVLTVDGDWRVDKRALLDELKLIRDFSREEFMRYGRLISPDFTIFSSSELTMKYCYLKLRQMSLFTHRIAYPQIKSYTIKPLPGGSTLEFLMIPSENVQN